MTTQTKVDPRISRDPPRRPVATAVWTGITAMLVVMACAAPFSGDGSTDGVIGAVLVLLIFAALTGTAAWSASTGWSPALADGVSGEDGGGSWSEDWFNYEDISSPVDIIDTHTDPSYDYMPENIYYTGD